ncbi:MAG: hypothetical protein AB2L14_18045 [Candidatus Xenobiia bacterium LiM19]
MTINNQPGGISYSPAGSDISRRYLEMADKTAEESEKRELFGQGFRDLYSSPDTTEAEKALACLGWEIGANKSTSAQSARQAESFIFNIIKAGIPAADTIGGLLARTALDAAQSQSNGGVITFQMPDADGEQIRADGFEVIAKDPNTVDNEKKLAILGSTMDSRSIGASPELTALAQSSILTAISQTGISSSPLAPVVVKAALDVADNVAGLSPESQDQVLLSGLYVHLKQDESSEAEKALTAFGMNIPERMGDDVGASVKRDILHSIADNTIAKESGAGAVIDKARSLLKDDTEPSVSRELLRSAFASISQYCKGDAGTEVLSSMALSIGKEKQFTDTAARDIMLKMMDCLPGQKDEFTLTAESLAKKTKELCSPALSEEEKVFVIKMGLDTVTKLNNAGDREKRFAQYGVDMGKDMQTGIALKVSTALLDIISTPQEAGKRDLDTAADIAQAAMDSGASLDEKSRIAEAVFSFIKNDADATEYEKTLAQMGIAMGSRKQMSGEGSGAVRSNLFNILRDKGLEASPDMKTICTIARDAAALAGSPADGACALRGAFESLAAYPNATPTEKMIGRLGASIGRADINAAAGLKAQTTVLDALISSKYPAGSPGVMMAELAKQAVVNRGFTSGSERKALRGACECIASEAQASPQERDIAGLAVSMGGNSEMHDEPGAHIRAALLDELIQSSAPAGSREAVLAEAAKKAVSSRIPMCDGRKALKGALDYIEGSSKSGGHEKALASLAINMGGHKEMTDDSAFRIRLALLDSFNQPISSTDSRAGIFARLAIKTSQEGLLWGDVRKALRGAFEAMQADSTIADDVKKLAGKGIDAGAVDSLTDEEGVRVRLKVMNEIIEIAMKEEEASKAALQQDLAALNEKLQGDSASGSLEVNDDYIEIDGVRIDVHKSSGGK